MTRRSDKSIKVDPFYAVQSRTLRNSAKTSCEWSLILNAKGEHGLHENLSGRRGQPKRHKVSSNIRFEDFRIAKKSFLCFG